MTNFPISGMIKSKQTR